MREMPYDFFSFFQAGSFKIKICVGPRPGHLVQSAFNNCPPFTAQKKNLKSISFVQLYHDHDCTELPISTDAQAGKLRPGHWCWLVFS